MTKMLECNFHQNCRNMSKNSENYELRKFIRKNLLDNLEAEKEVLENINKIALMQFLGLKDKNGRIIYFGDILVDNLNNLLTPVIEIENEEHILFFKPIKHLHHPLLNIGCKSTYSQTLEVIGNIYRKSELFAGMQESEKILQLLITADNKNCSSENKKIELKGRT